MLRKAREEAEARNDPTDTVKARIAMAAAAKQEAENKKKRTAARRI
jgi:hypothetical protein